MRRDMMWNGVCFATLSVSRNSCGVTSVFQALQVLALVLVAVAMALALAHALELPGKLRVPKDTYLAIQPIYYPGFTIGGMSEPLGLFMLLLLMTQTPITTLSFWLTLGAFLAL